MNMHRPYPVCSLLVAAVMLGLLSAASLAQGQPAGDPAGSKPPADAAPAPAGAPSAPVDAAAPPPAKPLEAMATATARAPATLVIDRQAAAGDVYLDLNVLAFKPPRHGGVEAVVTLAENKAGAREVDVGTFTIFPARKFEAKEPGQERGFRLNATQALAGLGADNAAVKVKVRLAPLHEGRSARGAKLTLGKVELVSREKIKEETKENTKENTK